MNSLAFKNWLELDHLSYTVQKDGNSATLTLNNGDSLGFTIIMPQSSARNGSVIVWGHWLGPHKSNRDQYLEEALEYAENGFASILFDAPWSRPDWYASRNLETEALNFKRIFQCFYSILDFAKGLKTDSSGGLFYIGHDYSAMFAMPVLSFFEGIRGSCLICFTYSFYDWAFFTQNPKDSHKYHADNDVYELSGFFDNFGSETMCQFADEDHYVNEHRRRAISERFARQGSTVKVYSDVPGDAHELDFDPARSDRKKWLLNLLKNGLQ